MKPLRSVLVAFSEWCHIRIGRGAFIISLVIFMVFLTMILPQVSVTSRQVTGTSTSPDTSFWYSAEELYSIAETYGEAGRAYYIRSRFTFDVVWPLVYGFFLVSALTLLYRSFPKDGYWRRTNLLPAGAVILDYLENSAASIVMFRFPAPTPVIAELTPFFTLFKWLFLYAGFLLLFVGVILVIERRIRGITSRKRRIGVRSLLVFLLLSMVLTGAFFWYVNDYSRALPEARLALESNEEVSVYERGNYTIFEPLTGGETGLIFYPGGKVEETAYAPLLREIAAGGVTTVLVRMPFRLAVFGINRADDAFRQFPEITYWSVGGHSLGGAMAARYAASHPAEVDALVLWASYPDQDLAESDIDVLSIHGTMDGLIDRETIESTKMLLPEDSVFVWIDGGNHAQFGLYGEQDGDLPAEIPAEEQHRMIIEETVAFLNLKHRMQ